MNQKSAILRVAFQISLKKSSLCRGLLKKSAGLLTDLPRSYALAGRCTSVRFPALRPFGW